MTDNTQLAMLARSRRKKAHAHWWIRIAVLDDPNGTFLEYCDICKLPRTDYEARQRRGRSSLRAGKDAERSIAKAYTGQRVGQYGGASDVVVGDVLCINLRLVYHGSLSGSGRELQKLPRTGGRIPTLIVSDRPGPGRRTRRLSIRLTEDDVELLGNEAQRSLQAIGSGRRSR